MSVSGHSVCGVRVECVDEVCGAGWDALVVVTVAGPGAAPLPHVLQDFVAAHHELDPASKERGCVSVVRCGRVCGGRLVLSAAGELGPYDDVRSLGEAAAAGVSRCVSCGCRSIVLALQQHARFPRAPLVMLLGALEALYVPLQTRESFPSRGHAVSALGVYGEGVHHVPALVSTASALEVGRTLARDVGGGDPERMTPMKAADYITKELAGLPHTVVSVLDDAEQIARRYPLLAAVSRAADTIDRHRGCVVYVEYAPPQYDRTLMLVGKGVTYDTGGCDIKAGGAMAGMSRDKCGAAAIAGLVKSVALLSGRVRVRAWLGLVRNSVGAAAYVADELLTSRGTQPVRVGNTDAEGRLVMADLLHEAREAAAGERAGTCHVYTVATLTGHAHRAAGAGYSIVMDNHVARDAGHAGKMQRRGDELGDMIEVSTIRREDLAAHAGRCAGDALHQADNKPSTQVPRGHQGPAGFLLRVSGFDSGSVPYSHVDIAASAGELPHNPTAAPLLALAGVAGVIDG